MKRSLVLLVAAAAVAIFAVASASGDAKKDKGKTRTFELEQTVTSIQQVDNPPSGPSPGDLLVLTQNGTSEDGDQLATSQVFCVVITPPKAECTATTIFGDGQISATGPVDPTESAPQLVAITGGTGAFEGAKGSIEIRNVGPGQSDSTFHLVR